MNNKSLYILSVLVLSIRTLSTFGQFSNNIPAISKFDNYRNRTLQEKIYVHTDRCFYIVGETIWFAIYNQDASEHQSIDISKLAYVEILDKENNVVSKAKVELKDGKGNGSILISFAVPSGTYLLRAYTHWMKNFDPDYYYEKIITIVNTFKVSTKESESVQVHLLPDVQFFPEGGNLIEGVESKVAFKALDAAGKSFDFKGAIINQANDTLVRFRPFKFGMGHFYITPSSKEIYRAIIQGVNGSRSIHDFVPVVDHGFALAFDNKKEEILVSITDKSKENLFVDLLIHARASIVFSGRQSLTNGKASFTIDKAKLKEGISSFTIFDDAGRPVCERLFFKKVENKLLIDVKENRETLPIKANARLEITTRSVANALLEASLSVSVFRMDSLEYPAPNEILSYLYLTSDLKGNIESPEYYFQSNNQEADEAIDNLMLTQGWRRYKWSTIFSNKDSVLSYLPEFRGNIIQGNVTERKTGKNASGVRVFLSKPNLEGEFYTAVSNKEGKIVFGLKNQYGQSNLITQVQPPDDSLYHVEITDNYSKFFSNKKLPFLNLNKKWKAPLTERGVHMQLLNFFYKDSKGKSSQSIDTASFYGKPDERYRLDDYTRFPTMEDVLREYVKGVWVRKKDEKFQLILPNPMEHRVIKDPLVTLDGTPIFNINDVMKIDPLKIKQIDVTTRKLYLGSFDFEGLVAITSYKGDMAGLPLQSTLQTHLFDGLQLSREFYSPKYETEIVKNRIPDFRELLYWNPKVTTDATGKAILEFYTSELEGTYFVVTQGITKEGIAGSNITTLKVVGH